jgi:hypothetical protein
MAGSGCRGVSWTGPRSSVMPVAIVTDAMTRQNCSRTVPKSCLVAVVRSFRVSMKGSSAKVARSTSGRFTVAAEPPRLVMPLTTASTNWTCRSVSGWLSSSVKAEWI